MPATASRIGFVLRAYRSAVSETAGTAARHGNLARESADPIEAYFSSKADALTRAAERQTLLSADRRMFEVKVAGADLDMIVDMLAATDIPQGVFIDEERGIEMDVCATEVVVDLDTQSGSLKVWG